jgi:bacillolysin
MRLRRMWPAIVALVVLALPVMAGEPVRISAVDAEASAWDQKVESLTRDGVLVLRSTRGDALVPGRTHQRFGQVYKGVPVFGGELVRQSTGRSVVSIFGSLYEGIDVDPAPSLTAEAAKAVVERLSGARLGPGCVPRLLVLPGDEGGYALVWSLRAMTQNDLVQYFVDAHTGADVLHYSALERQSAVGLGTGVLGDQKKVSSFLFQSQYYADDRLRPPSLTTFDMKGDLGKTIDFLNGFPVITRDDYAQDQDNTWTDGPDVDAHVYSGYVYDYYYKRFGRHGLDAADLRITNIVHPVKRSDEGRYSSEIFDLFFINAFYGGNGVMVYGEGSDHPSFGQRFTYFSAGLDIVAHELTHGVTDYTSRLIYRDEPGALNEAFSDIMAIGVEFFFQTPGDGPLHADYLLGEDVATPGGIRSAKDPRSYGYPDHYSRRYLGPQDGGGVHVNSSIANHAFYLAIEGGANRTSGLTVEGVGGANREQIEKVFYRAFTQMLPSSATFATARAATIQAARDLYGAGSAPERAVTQAWRAVGVS